MADKRGLVILLVIAMVAIFIGLVWAIATYLPLNLAAAPSPTFTADVSRVAMNCTSPIAFWKQHTELYPAQVVIGGQVYNALNLNQVFSGQAEDVPAKLQAQLTAAYLNILSGADQSYIETTIFEAYTWLVQHPAGSQVTDSEQEEGTRLFNLLEAYNLGLTGVKLCESASLTLTEAGTATETATVTTTVTPSQTNTTPASGTPTPIENTATATYEYIPPTRAATRTSEPPIQYPTNTPIQPTEAPAPTNTSAPPAPTNTSAPPAPTNTPVTPEPPTPVPTDTPILTPVPS
jgi:hypothetical protein